MSIYINHNLLRTKQKKLQETKWLAKALVIYKHMPCVALIYLINPSPLRQIYTHSCDHIHKQMLQYE